MDSNIKALWISALKSGDYAQGKHSLNNKGKFCCLGVLCDLAAKAGAIVEPEVYREDENEDGFLGDVYSYDGEINMLPRSVMEWAGLSNNSGILPAHWIEHEGVQIDSLWELNDLAEYAFNQIAEVIEEQF